MKVTLPETLSLRLKESLINAFKSVLLSEDSGVKDVQGELATFLVFLLGKIGSVE